MKNKIKYVYSDLDGTIVSWNPKNQFTHQGKTYKNLHEVSHATVTAFKQLQAQGIKIGIVTGRDYCRVRWLEKYLNTDLPTITLDGAIIYFRDEIIRQEVLDKEFIHGINQIVKRYPTAAFKLNMGWGNYYTCNPSLIFEGDHAYREHFNADSKFYRKEIDNTVDWDINNMKVNQVYFDTFTCPEPMIQELDNLVEKSDVTAKSYRHSLYIIKKGVSKASALQNLQRDFLVEMKPANTIVFGDGDNDIEMMQWADHSVSLTGSDPECYKLAKYHTDSVDDDGIAKWINKNLLC
ncbi:HAD family hydrolase [Mycoplasmoides pneumoniae]|uniref:Putative phosphatase MPN_381 n=4 Tax=Mycoplasmoides pneumoniae TaxID=2104 RepID=Y381_MYCPN|nr:HAD family hydrolase [Mycoplasmoides pneumoniae]P75401.1 RecName: Full=Putative phosphatase MPN_381 [Mycoplasmoides pneumoniae M129]AAB96104.1 HAD superfamily hydrolase/phosphatase [Mycoplasmoides pneumoniae M129]ADK86665.1 Cof-like hydrolase [Mycoplasmoides pneumoniae FH]AGC04289.1 hypothetical protein C985_0384 [Mycoplasmoides pneumoniae M129-B7]ALA30260.1 hypothetical protein C897_02175 [Mycoplasmoides pneumoniae PI 1428]ALA31209.1 hypothetical protein B434_03665 [Mycoplasmoides pneumon